MKFFATALALAAAASAQITVTSIPTSAVTKIENDLTSYFKALTTEPGFTSLVQVILTASVPTSYLAQPTDLSGASGVFSAFNEAITGTPDWLKGLPAPQQSYIKSVLGAEASIVNNDAGSGAGGSSSRAAAPTPGSNKGIMAMGAAAAAVLGAAAVL